jgi:hypothetical protein
VTSFLRASGQGLWLSGGGTQEDSIAVVEIMVARLDNAFWRSLRERLERELAQEEIVIRAQEITQLYTSGNCGSPAELIWSHP